MTKEEDAGVDLLIRACDLSSRLLMIQCCFLNSNND